MNLINCNQQLIISFDMQCICLGTTGILILVWKKTRGNPSFSFHCNTVTKHLMQMNILLIIITILIVNLGYTIHKCM